MVVKKTPPRKVLNPSGGVKKGILPLRFLTDRSPHFENGFSGNIVQNNTGHHVPGAQGAENELVAGHLVHFWHAEMSEIEQNETDEQQHKGDEHGTMHIGRSYGHNYGINGPGNKVISHICR